MLKFNSKFRKVSEKEEMRLRDSAYKYMAEAIWEKNYPMVKHWFRDFNHWLGEVNERRRKNAGQ